MLRNRFVQWLTSLSLSNLEVYFTSPPSWPGRNISNRVIFTLDGIHSVFCMAIPKTCFGYLMKNMRLCLYIQVTSKWTLVKVQWTLVIGSPSNYLQSHWDTMSCCHLTPTHLNIGLAYYSDILPKLKSKLHTCSVGNNVEMAPDIRYINPLHSSNIFSCNRDGVSHVGVGNVNLYIQVCDVLDTRVVRIVNLETIQ